MARLDSSSSPRPVIIVSNTTTNKFSPNISIIPITSQLLKRSYPTHANIKFEESESTALTELVTTIPKNTISNRLFSLSEADLNTVNQTLLIHFGIK